MISAALLRLALILAAALGCTVAARAAAPGIGINYDWWKLVPVPHAQCKADGSPAADGRWILPAYGDPRVRETVRAQLRAMRAAGFTTLRSLVFFYHSDEPAEDSFASTDGRIAPADRAKLAAYTKDVAAAGFTRFEVVPAFQAENELYCRNRTWGDCFDAKRTDENWRFISGVASTVREAAGGMHVRFDLANEGAPDPSMPAATRAAAARYLQTIAGRFEAAYGSEWLISVARSDASTDVEAQNRLETLLADLAAVRLHPHYLELHLYSTDGNDLTMTLDRAQAVAEKSGASIVLGELRYQNAVQAGAIASWLRKHPDSRIVDLIPWPEYDPTLPCAPMPEPPYAPGPYLPLGAHAAG